MIAVMSAPPCDPAVPAPLARFDPALLRAARTLRLRAGEVLFRTGGRPRTMHYVEVGEIVLQRVSEAGGLALLQRAAPGAFVAEASLTAARYHCDGVCRDDAVLLAFPIPALRAAIDAHAGTRWAWVERLAAQVRAERLRVERLALRTLTDRLRHLVLTEGTPAGEYRLAGTRMQLAAELGVTHEALYRALARLQRQGAVVVEGDRLRWRG
jgi:CRP-like cAMP-binding protein